MTSSAFLSPRAIQCKCTPATHGAPRRLRHQALYTDPSKVGSKLVKDDPMSGGTPAHYNAAQKLVANFFPPDTQLKHPHGATQSFGSVQYNVLALLIFPVI